MATPREIKKGDEVVVYLDNQQTRAIVDYITVSGSLAADLKEALPGHRWRAGERVMFFACDWRPVMHGDEDRGRGCDWCGADHCKLCGLSFEEPGVYHNRRDPALCQGKYCDALARRFPPFPARSISAAAADWSEKSPDQVVADLGGLVASSGAEEPEAMWLLDDADLTLLRSKIDGMKTLKAEAATRKDPGNLVLGIPRLLALLDHREAEAIYRRHKALEQVIAVIDRSWPAVAVMAVLAAQEFPAPRERLVPSEAMQADEDFAAHLERGARWCRARLLRALGQAAAQGVLDEVIAELFPDNAGDAVLEQLLAALVATGWLPRGARLLP